MPADTLTPQDVVRSLTERLHHPPIPNDDHGPRSRRWWAQSIAHGAAGIAILHATLDRTDQNRDLVHRWLTAAVTEELSAASGAGAWFGAPAVGFALAHSAPQGAYRRARAALDQALTDMIRDRLDHARHRIRSRERPQLREFDLVNGLSGLGGYLLQRDAGNPLVEDVLAYLVRLTEPVAADDPAGATVPGWWTADPPPRHPTLGAHSDQGAAHGIAGPLSLLALAGRAGVWVPGQREAMQRIGAWYDQLARTDGTACWWPQRYSWPEHTRATPPLQEDPGRPSWCYNIGIARALQLSGLALDEPDRRHQAEAALLGAVTNPVQLEQITDVSLCHGWAGTALTLWCAAHDSPDPALGQALPALTASLTGAAHALPVDAPIGLIQGAAGAAITLHSLTERQTEGWARCLLLI